MQVNDSSLEGGAQLYNIVAVFEITGSGLYVLPFALLLCTRQEQVAML